MRPVPTHERPARRHWHRHCSVVEELLHSRRSVQKRHPGDASMTSFQTLFTRIRIRTVPPSELLEGIDLRHYEFREGQVYEVGPRLGELLVACGYAEQERRPEERDQADSYLDRAAG